MAVALWLVIIAFIALVAYAIYKGFNFLNNHEDGDISIECGDSKKYFKLSASCKKAQPTQEMNERTLK